MSKLRTIVTPAGETLVVLPLPKYEALVNAATDAKEDEADLGAYEPAKAGLTSGAESISPPEICKLILNGDVRLKAVPEWRRRRHSEVAARAGIGQGYLSDLEHGKGSGAPDTLVEIADFLGVPADWIA